MKNEELPQLLDTKRWIRFGGSVVKNFKMNVKEMIWRKLYSGKRCSKDFMLFWRKIHIVIPICLVSSGLKWIEVALDSMVSTTKVIRKSKVVPTISICFNRQRAISHRRFLMRGLAATSTSTPMRFRMTSERSLIHDDRQDREKRSALNVMWMKLKKEHNIWRKSKRSSPHTIY